MPEWRRREKRGRGLKGRRRRKSNECISWIEAKRATINEWETRVNESCLLHSKTNTMTYTTFQQCVSCDQTKVHNSFGFYKRCGKRALMKAHTHPREKKTAVSQYQVSPTRENYGGKKSTCRISKPDNETMTRRKWPCSWTRWCGRDDICKRMKNMEESQHGGRLLIDLSWESKIRVYTHS